MVAKEARVGGPAGERRSVSLAWRERVTSATSSAVMDSASVLVEEERGSTVGILSIAGRVAGNAARRALLLWALEENRWNMTATSIALRVGSASNVLRAIKELGLGQELEAARRQGLVVRGAHKKKSVTEGTR